MGESDRRFELNWVQSLAGALAAVTSAVLLSTVGVPRTLICAALGSLAATVVSAVYSYYIRATQDRVATAGTVAVSRMGRDRSRAHQASDDPAAGASGTDEEAVAAGEDLYPAPAALEDAKDPRAGSLTTVLAGLPWKRIAVVATGLFVAAMVVILAFELVTGRAVSSYTGGSDSDRRTSIPGLGGGRDQDDPAGDQDGPQPTPGETPSGEPDESIGETEQPTPSPTPTAETEETAVPPLTESPGETATSGYTPSPTPSPTSPAAGSPPPSP